MKITNPLVLARNVLVGGNKNAAFSNLGKRFLKYGNKDIYPGWSRVIMTDQDMYTGIPYAAINNRANTLARTAGYIKTRANDSTTNTATGQNEEVIHPYLDIINMSPTFSNYHFWYLNSTYLDLEGITYILVKRNFSESAGLMGKVLEFQLLNAYDVRRVVNARTKEIGGYVEHRGGMIREIPVQQMIDISTLNPFDWTDPYSMADAARDNQFTLKSAGDYTRHAITKNVNAPGIVTVGDNDLALDDERFQNFKARVMGHVKGEPLFGIGKGSLSWDDMQTDMNKVAMGDVFDINLKTLSAVTGNSKTKLSIEESGTTRDTSRVQNEQFSEDHVQPQLQLIIDALNQDYKNNYPQEYEKYGYELYIDNPLGKDHDDELKDVEVKDSIFALTMTLIDRGYDIETAARYAKGEIDIDDIGEPTNVLADASVGETPPASNKTKLSVVKVEPHIHVHSEPQPDALDVNKVLPSVRPDNPVVAGATSSLQANIVSIEQKLVGHVIDKLTSAQNAFDTEDDLINKSDKKSVVNQLELALTAFYGVVINLYGSNVMAKRTNEFTKLKPGVFKLNAQVKTYIKKISTKVAKSHVDTVLNDMRKVAQTQAKRGASIQEITSNLRQEYADHVSKARASTISRTETNRAFTQSQYQADDQFIKQNDLGDQAYKKWVTHSSNPCQYCLELEAEPPIPFDINFRDLGDDVSVSSENDSGDTTVKSLPIDFEPLEAGDAHPNCFCDYELIIKG